MISLSYSWNQRVTFNTSSTLEGSIGLALNQLARVSDKHNKNCPEKNADVGIKVELRSPCV